VDNKQDLILKGLRQRLVEIVAEYEDKLITFRVDATLENDKLKRKIEDQRIQIESLEEELQIYRNREMEVRQ
jgi:anti-sigma regulatory factor (Ser/Thr protein kinase)